MRSGRRARSGLLFLLSTSILALSATPVVAQDCPELVGRWPYGPVPGVTVSGGYAYFGSGGAMVIADVCGPAGTAGGRLGRDARPSRQLRRLRRLRLRGGLTTEGLRVIDVSTPSAPVEVGSLGTSGRRLRCRGLGQLRLRRGRASRPSSDRRQHARRSRSRWLPRHAGRRLRSSRSRAATPTSRTWNRGPPSDRREHAVDAGRGRLRRHARRRLRRRGIGRLRLRGGLTTAGLRVLDISDPRAPVEVGFVDTPGTAAAVAVVGGYAYVADYDQGLRVIDVRHPSDPVEVGLPRHAGMGG